MKKAKKKDEVYIEVTEADYQAGLAKGIDEESLLKPGRHKFVRGLFKKRHPDFSLQTGKARITIYLDTDIIAYFRARADQPNAAPYQTQINQALREIMERDSKKAPILPPQAIDLLENPRFIQAVADRVAAQTSATNRKRTRRAKAA